jgi:hypothetical protein
MAQGGRGARGRSRRNSLFQSTLYKPRWGRGVALARRSCSAAVAVALSDFGFSARLKYFSPFCDIFFQAFIQNCEVAWHPGHSIVIVPFRSDLSLPIFE